MGRWSRKIAPHFVSWLHVFGDAHWLDVGCGTGALTNAICSHASPASVVGCDPAEPFIEYAWRHSQDGRASFVVAGAGSLPRRIGGYDSVSSLFALNFFPDARGAIREMRALSAPRGTVSACVWDYASKMEFLRLFWDTVGAFDPAARELDEAIRFPLCTRAALEALFRWGELQDVECEPIEIETEFTTFEDYWWPLLGGTGPAPSYVALLDDNRRDLLARKLEQALSRGSSGPFTLTARAWAIRGVVR